MENDSAILFKLEDNEIPSSDNFLLTPENLMFYNRCNCCRGRKGRSETFVAINYQIFNLCKECSKTICVKCHNRKTFALDKLNHMCNDCTKNDK